MTRIVKSSPKAGRLNEMLAGASAPTQAMSNSTRASSAGSLSDMVKQLQTEKGQDWFGTAGNTDRSADLSDTHSFHGPKTKAYAVSSTKQMTASNSFNSAPGTSPVTISGKSKRPVSSGESSSLLHSTIEALHTASEHTGNNQEVINSLVKD